MTDCDPSTFSESDADRPTVIPFEPTGGPARPRREPNPPIESVLTPGAIRAVVQAISDNTGNEVFFVGKLNTDNLVEDVLPGAFGGQAATPAIIREAEDGDVVIHNHPTGDLRPSQADINVASALGQRSIGFYIVDNACSRVHVVVPAFEQESLHLLDPNRIDALLGPEGVLARNMAAYEYRTQQIEMARLICRGFNEDATVVVEAGTGTGKSMAYLIPSALWSSDNRDKVVVSTNTINLQEQLIHKDIPFLRRALNLPIKAELVKGRGNYLCMRKLEEAGIQKLSLFEPSQSDQLETIFEWAKHTNDGSLSDLSFKPDFALWEDLRSEADSCSRVRCGMYQDCFFYRARRRASAANVLVVNHALLMTDLAVRMETGNYTAAAVLPPYHRMVLDEGHNLEEAASRAFSHQVTNNGLRYMLRRWANPERRGAGVLSLFLHRLADVALKEDPVQIEEIKQIVHEQLSPGSGELAAICQEMTERILPSLHDYLRRRGGYDPDHRHQVRIVDDVRADAFWTDVLEPCTQQLHAAVRKFVAQADRLIKATDNLSRKTAEQIQSAILQIESHTNRMRLVAQNLGLFLDPDPNTCVWMETQRGRSDNAPPILRWMSAPIEMGPMLRKALFEPARTVVVTSATLTVDGKFDFVLGRVGVPTGADRRRDLGALMAADAGVGYGDDREYDPDSPEFAPDRLDDPKALRLSDLPDTDPFTERPPLLGTIASPFDYYTQAFVAAPQDMPDPRAMGYETALADTIMEAVQISKGRAMVLFTSYSLIQRIAARIRPRLEPEGYAILQQGETARHFLLHQFRTTPRAVLLATASFWEGVDIPGDDLVMLILARLPFAVPSEPVLQARVEAIEARGGNSFREYSVPSAVIRFKQGFGRLIRNRTDSGAILILDSRVVRQYYGRAFLHSLPPHTTHKPPLADLGEALRRFFATEA